MKPGFLATAEGIVPPPTVVARAVVAITVVMRATLTVTAIATVTAIMIVTVMPSPASALSRVRATLRALSLTPRILFWAVEGGRKELECGVVGQGIGGASTLPVFSESLLALLVRFFLVWI